jgi:hypothetical protein
MNFTSPLLFLLKQEFQVLVLLHQFYFVELSSYILDFDMLVYLLHSYPKRLFDSAE